MALAVEARSISSQGSNSVTDQVVTLPTTRTTGALGIMLFAADGTPTLSGTDIGGWTLIGSSQTLGTSMTRWWYAREWTGAEGSTITVTTSTGEKTAHRCWSVTGWDDLGAITDAVKIGTPATGTSTGADPPSLDPFSGASAEYLWLVGMVGEITTLGLTAYPTNYDTNGDTVNAGAGGPSIAAGDRLATASSEDPGAFTHSSTAWAADTLAVKPASGGGGTSGLLTNRSERMAVMIAH